MECLNVRIFTELHIQQMFYTKFLKIFFNWDSLYGWKPLQSVELQEKEVEKD